MKVVYAELEALLKHRIFVQAHERRLAEITESGRNMLRSTLDEVRLHHADRFAQAVLKLQDIDDACHFRQSVLRRELSGEVAYDKQRDHSAHTVNLYLLGWYLYLNSPRLQAAFAEHAARRGVRRPKIRVHKYFRNVWMWASLLHDVGYLFEGGLTYLSNEVQAAHVQRGARHCMDYFEHRLWAEVGLGVDERQWLLSTSGVPIPQLDVASLAGVANGLRQLPTLERLRQQLKKDRRVRPKPAIVAAKLGPAPDPATPELERPPLRGDAFGLWAQHFHAHDQPTMAARMSALAGVYESLVWDGLPKAGVRILDHGVAGGLLLLQYTTFYFAIRAALEGERTLDAETAAAWEKFRGRDGLNYRASTWWQAVLWGTAATALHNVQQDREAWSATRPALTPLALEEDPIAWLGVLADILQDWDRYPVSRGRYLFNGAVTSPRLPLEGRFVQLGAARGQPSRIQFPEAFHDDVGKALRKALLDVDEVVTIGIGAP